MMGFVLSFIGIPSFFRISMRRTRGEEQRRSCTDRQDQVVFHRVNCYLIVNIKANNTGKRMVYGRAGFNLFLTTHCNTVI
jgi:hypothetical protein